MKKAKTIESLAKNFKRYLESEEGQKSVSQYFEKRVNYYTRELERVDDFLRKNEITRELELKLIRYFERYETFRFEHRGEIATSNIFNAIVRHVTKNGREIESNNEDFIVGTWMWNGYVFEWFMGQGSYWRVRKNNRIIHQTN